jgi:hypothetical protein
LGIHILKEAPTMDHAADRITDHQRRVLDFALDALGLQHARPETERTLSEILLRQTVVALHAENRVLRARVETLECQLYPADADLDALEREVDHRAARDRARQPGI